MAAFHEGTPIARWMVFVRENPSSKWMMTGGSLVYGNLQMAGLKWETDDKSWHSHGRLGMNGVNVGLKESFCWPQMAEAIKLPPHS